MAVDGVTVKKTGDESIAFKRRKYKFAFGTRTRCDAILVVGVVSRAAAM